MLLRCEGWSRPCLRGSTSVIAVISAARPLFHRKHSITQKMERVLIRSFHDIHSSPCIICFKCMSSASSAGSRMGQSRRSRSALATSLDPPSLTEGMISSAIQRRTVRIDVPTSRAISAARRYSARLVMTAFPKGGTVEWTDRLRRAAQSFRARLAAPRGAQVRPARLRRGWCFSWYLNEPEPCPPERFMAKRAQSQVIELPGSHAIFLSHATRGGSIDRKAATAAK
jgi:hypothetical protein